MEHRIRRKRYEVHSHAPGREPILVDTFDLVADAERFCARRHMDYKETPARGEMYKPKPVRFEITDTWADREKPRLSGTQPGRR